MTVRELYDKLLSVKHAFDFFGKISSMDELRKKFREFSKLIHPDNVSSKDKYIANEAFSMLNRLYTEGEKEIEAGIYGVVDPVQIYKKQQPLFDLNINNKKYDFYENIFEGEVACVYKGICNGELVYLKLGLDPDDNSLLEKEYDVLRKNGHQLLPYVEAKIKINGCSALLMREATGTPMPEFMDNYPNGIPAEHVMWMLERLLNVTGWLHSNKIVHGNIKPENIIIDKETHKVTLLGLSFCIPEANTTEAHYQIINDFYTAPEVNKNTRVMPNTDIYSIGKVAIKMLGGNINNNGMPINIDSRIRTFIRKLVDENPHKRPGDAWQLWDELIKLRTEVYGNKRFQTLD